MSISSLFGLNLSSEFPFLVSLRPGSEPRDLLFDLLEENDSSFRTADPLYRSRRQLRNGESLLCLYRLSDREVLSFPRGLFFEVLPAHISGFAGGQDATELLEGQFLGPVLSYWLERRGVPTLHASAVQIGSGAIGFLSSQGGGKSGLAAALMQVGHPLLTDDILPVEEIAGAFSGRSGYPQMKMWPDEAAHFLGGHEHLPRVHPEIAKRRVAVGEGGWGAFQESSLPLAALYVPERREGGPVEIQPLSRQQAVIELVRHSFSPHLVQAVGLQPARLDLLARLVRQVPVRRLAYPSGFDQLPSVVEALRRDLQA